MTYTWSTDSTDGDQNRFHFVLGVEKHAKSEGSSPCLTVSRSLDEAFVEVQSVFACSDARTWDFSKLGSSDIPTAEPQQGSLFLNLT